MRYRSFTYILGSKDVEMAAIQTLLKKEKCLVVNATIDGFNGVRASGAYSAAEEPSPSTVWIECAPTEGKGLIETTGAVLIDHHHQKDPGFHLGPEKYMSAASIGQLLYFMVRNGYKPDWESSVTSNNDGYSYSRTEVSLTYQGTKYLVPKYYRYLAAADHCLANAYKGACPAIDVEELKKWREENFASFQKSSVSSVVRLLEETMDILTKCPEIVLGDHKVIDARHTHLKYMNEAAARLGRPVLASKAFYNNSGEKITIQATNPDLIAFFLEEWGPSMGLTGLYGSKYRGIAGGYLQYKGGSK